MTTRRPWLPIRNNGKNCGGRPNNMIKQFSQANSSIRKFTKSLIAFLRPTIVFALLSAWFTILFCLIFPAVIKMPVPRWTTWWWCFIAFYALPVIGGLTQHMKLGDRLMALFFKNPIAWL